MQREDMVGSRRLWDLCHTPPGYSQWEVLRHHGGKVRNLFTIRPTINLNCSESMFKPMSDEEEERRRSSVESKKSQSLTPGGYKLRIRNQSGTRKQVAWVYRARSRGKLVLKTTVSPSSLTQTCSYKNWWVQNGDHPSPSPPCGWTKVNRKVFSGDAIKGRVPIAASFKGANPLMHTWVLAQSHLTRLVTHFMGTKTKEERTGNPQHTFNHHHGCGIRWRLRIWESCRQSLQVPRGYQY